MSRDVEITGTLENWRVKFINDEEMIIWGNLNGDIHKRWREGQYIHTSGIAVRGVKEGDVVTTRNSVYKLGKKLEVRE
jgi:hypothetical protein